MTVFALNVGLKIDATGFIIPADLAISVLGSHGIHPAYDGAQAPRVEHSDTEPTLAGWFTDNSLTPGWSGTHRDIHRIAAALQQKAIAVVWPGDIGELVGPHKNDWNNGQFDPTHFIKP